MKINHQKTKEKFEEACYSQAKVARSLKIGKTIFCRVLQGNYPSMESDLAKKVICKLRELGVLVFDPEDQKAA